MHIFVAKIGFHHILNNGGDYVENLIKNSSWAPGPMGGPQYFSAKGPVTYDKLSVEGNRTCSITMTMPGYAQDYYVPLIKVAGQKEISFGYVIRTVDAQSIALSAEFANERGMFMTMAEQNITKEVGSEFTQVIKTFPIPKGATYVRLSLKFMGMVTACTFYAPIAYFK